MINPNTVNTVLEKIKNTPVVQKAISITTEINDRLNGDKNIFTGEPSKYGGSGSGVIELLNPAGLIGRVDDVAQLSKNISRVAKTYKRPVKIIEDAAQTLNEYGLSKVDTYRLMEDGWELDQIFEALGRHGVGVPKIKRANDKAKLITQEMIDIGMSPKNQSKYDYLKGLKQKIYKDKYGNPMTEQEFKKRYPNEPLAEMSLSELDKHYLFE